jgi:HD-GYP domain-containing protein (c-di-GMP phosphodiesterase class II)
MLSDRPYRDALPLPAVLEQLEQNAGRQFDHRVVRAALRSAVLAEYAETMHLVRVETTRARAVDQTAGIPKLAVVGTGLAEAAVH